MIYDSLMVIDKNGRKRIIKLHMKNIRNDKKIKHTKPHKEKFIIGEVNSGMSYTYMQNMLNTGITFHLGHKGRENLLKSLLDTEDKKTKRQLINSKRTHTYRKRHVYKKANSQVFISRGSLKKIKKYLSYYGKYSIKTIYSVLSPDSILLESCDKDVFKHLYLYNSKINNSISLENYILISSMSNAGIDYWYDQRYRLTGDDFNEYKIALKKGEFNQLKFIKNFNI